MSQRSLLDWYDPIFGSSWLMTRFPAPWPIAEDLYNTMAKREEECFNKQKEAESDI